MKATLSKIYHSVPFKQHLFSTLKWFWTPPKRIYQHLSFKDDFEVRIDEEHRFKMNHFGYELENELFWNGIGGWEAVSFNLWVKLCKNAKVIFDVGANTGVFALIAKSINPNAKVYAFEPVERVCDKIIINNELNNYDIKAIQKAAANYDGKGKIYDPMGEHLYSVTVNTNKNNLEKEVAEVEIDTIKLSTFIKKEGLGKVDLLKIDVEGFEPEVLEGLEEYLSKYHPPMIVEILDNEVGAKVQEIVKDLNYLYFKVENNARLVPTKYLGNQMVQEHDDHNYFFCTEEEAKRLKLL